jgi:hypothetical protein
MQNQSLWARAMGLYKTRWWLSLPIIFSVLMILMLFEIKNHRFRANDFKVYHRAAGRLLNGENLYRPDIDGHYYFKYSPTAAVFFIPSAVLPFSAAKVLHWIVMAFVVCLGFYLSLKMARPDFADAPPQVINNLLLLIGVIVGVHMEREFFLGQVNHILLVLYIGMIYLISKGKNLIPSLLWAGSIFIKPFGLIFLPYYIIKKKLRLVALFFAFLAILAVLPLPFTGAAAFGNQYHHWLTELTTELSTRESLLQNENDTVFSILARYTPFRLLDFTPRITIIFQLVILAMIAVSFLSILILGCDLERGYVLEGAFLISMIPLLSFTNHYAFGFIELMIFVIVVNWNSLSKWTRIAAIVGFVATGMNMHDLWGGRIWQFLNEISLVAIGAIILLFVLSSLRLRRIA